MKKVIIDPEKFDKLAVARLSDSQLLMVKGGGSNPPGPQGDTIVIINPEPTPSPNGPIGQ